MSFGQSSGPPASAKQLAYLTSLVEQAGYDGFRDARHPLGLTQRQAGGKFTTREASVLIDQLLAAAAGDDRDNDPPPSSRPRSAAADRRAEAAAERLEVERAEAVRGIPAQVLVAELERRGWTAHPPPDQR